MTEHPLTNEICDQIHGGELGDGYPYDEDDMRDAADWQLERVMKWFDKRVTDYPETGVLSYIDILYNQNCRDDLYRLKNDLKKAMRPTTQEDN